MPQLRIDANDLPGQLDDALARLEDGDEVLVERDGAVVAQLSRCGGQPVRGNLQLYIEERLKAEPVGDWFVDAVMEAVAAGNQPAWGPTWSEEQSDWEQ